jgi:hypothetical protein
VLIYKTVWSEHEEEVDRIVEGVVTGGVVKMLISLFFFFIHTRPVRVNIRSKPSMFLSLFSAPKSVVE